VILQCSVITFLLVNVVGRQSSGGPRQSSTVRWQKVLRVMSCGLEMCSSFAPETEVLGGGGARSSLEFVTELNPCVSSASVVI
jgi:hypothetical protein